MLAKGDVAHAIQQAHLGAGPVAAGGRPVASRSRSPIYSRLSPTASVYSCRVQTYREFDGYNVVPTGVCVQDRPRRRASIIDGNQSARDNSPPDEFSGGRCEFRCEFLATLSRSSGPLFKTALLLRRSHGTQGIAHR